MNTTRERISRCISIRSNTKTIGCKTSLLSVSGKDNKSGQFEVQNFPRYRSDSHDITSDQSIQSSVRISAKPKLILNVRKGSEYRPDGELLTSRSAVLFRTKPLFHMMSKKELDTFDSCKSRESMKAVLQSSSKKLLTKNKERSKTDINIDIDRVRIDCENREKRERKHSQILQNHAGVDDEFAKDSPVLSRSSNHPRYLPSSSTDLKNILNRELVEPMIIGDDEAKCLMGTLTRDSIRKSILRNSIRRPLVNLNITKDPSVPDNIHSAGLSTKSGRKVSFSKNLMVKVFKRNSTKDVIKRTSPTNKFKTSINE